MSIIKSIDHEGRETTNVQPNMYTKSTVQELIQRGHTNIHDAETGEKYGYCSECMSTPCQQ